jgi:hypothetical protein
MVVSPILRGMLGLESDAQSHTVTFAPHIPADWRSFSLDNLRVGSTTVALSYQRTPGLLTLEVKRTDSDCTLDFNPAFSLRTSVASVELNGRSLPFRVAASASDQHVAIRFPLTQTTSTVRIRLKNDFGISVSNALPALGSASHSLRVLSETWNSSRTQLTLSLSGLAGKTYELSIWNPSQVGSVKGAKLGAADQDLAKLVVEFPFADAESYVHQDVVLNFARPR